jgi:hypothetical protein
VTDATGATLSTTSTVQDDRIVASEMVTPDFGYHTPYDATAITSPAGMPASTDASSVAGASTSDSTSTGGVCLANPPPEQSLSAPPPDPHKCTTCASSKKSTVEKWAAAISAPLRGLLGLYGPDFGDGDEGDALDMPEEAPAKVETETTEVPP